MVRSGFRVSPAEYETMCQPPKAKSPAAYGQAERSEVDWPVADTYLRYGAPLFPA